MKSSLIALVLATTWASAMADVYTGAKDQARRNGGANQGSAPANAQPSQPQNNNQPVDPALAATQANIANLRADIAALNRSVEAKPSSDERMALLNDLSAAAQGPKPATTFVQKLAGHLGTACLGKKTPPAEQLKLARAIHALFNGTHLSASQQPTILDQVQKIFANTGTPVDAIENVLTDLKAIATETR